MSIEKWDIDNELDGLPVKSYISLSLLLTLKKNLAVVPTQRLFSTDAFL